MSENTIHSMESTPLVNLQPTLDETDRISGVTARIYRKFCEHNFVDLHKKIFGPQDYCFSGEYRYWVWHDPGDRYRVFVSNRRGIGFEVNVKLVKTASEGLILFEEYASKLIDSNNL